ncbi:MAG TPA: universal stress protein [Pyrinomonadaceae bacterium]|nr:universal stress protein [Pyrinomonadaceae bacterium]
MKILVAYDGSEDADAALHDLKRAGLGSAVELLIMSVADVFVPPPIDEEVDNTFPLHVPEGVRRAHERARHELDEAQGLVKRASEQIRSIFPSWQVSYEAVADSPAWALIRKADEWKPDLIVMGARGLSVFGGRLILGSISQRVLYEARCSVRVARGSDSTDDKPVRILIGVDNSPDSKAAVDEVCNREWSRGTEVGLLVVVDTVMAIATDPADASAKWIEVAEEENWDQVRELFAPAAEKLRNAGLHAEVLIRRGNPADQLLQEAHTWGADCIFVGAKGTRGIDRLLLGSVSSAVSARAHCSVEVVRPKKS